MDNERNVIPSDGAAPSQGPQIPSFSRAFDMFMGSDGRSANFWLYQQRNNGFFVPSYLQGSTYMQRLEEAHKAQQVQKDGKQQNGASLQVGQGPGSLRSKSSASHLGMKFDVIERAPLFEADDTVAPLPSKWNKDDKSVGLEVLGDGLEVKYAAAKGGNGREHEYEVCSIKADQPIPPQAGLYYFEVQILPDTNSQSRRREEYVASVYPGCL